VLLAQGLFYGKKIGDLGLFFFFGLIRRRFFRCHRLHRYRCFRFCNGSCFGNRSICFFCHRNFRYLRFSNWNSFFCRRYFRFRNRHFYSFRFGNWRFGWCRFGLRFSGRFHVFLQILDGIFNLVANDGSYGLHRVNHVLETIRPTTGALQR